jgi:hypothetical protein
MQEPLKSVAVVFAELQRQPLLWALSVFPVFLIQRGVTL